MKRFGPFNNKRAGGSRRASVPGSLFESSIVFDTSERVIRNDSNPVSGASTSFASSSLTMPFSLDSPSRATSSTREEGTVRGISPRVPITTPSKTFSAQATALLMSYHCPRYRGESLASQIRALVDHNILRPEDIVDHSVSTEVYQPRFSVRASFYTQVATIVRDFQAFLYALAEQLPGRA